MTVHLKAEVTADRKIEITLPPEFPLGSVDLLVTVAAPNGQPKRPRSSLADWAEQNAEDWGSEFNSEDVESFTGRRF